MGPDKSDCFGGVCQRERLLELDLLRLGLCGYQEMGAACSTVSSLPDLPMTRSLALRQLNEMFPVAYSI